MGSALFAGMFVDDSATKNNRLGGVAVDAPSAWLVEFYCRLPACAGLSVLLAWLAMGALSAELAQRPYIAVGALAWMLLLLLALTSTRASQRWLGKNWRRLHRTIYLILPLVLVHMLWVVRADWGEWLAYALVGGLLLILRIPAVAMSLRLMRDVWK